MLYYHMSVFRLELFPLFVHYFLLDQGEFKDGILNRVGVLTRAEMNSTRFEGEWVNGLLEGEVKDHSFAQGWLEGYYKDGVPHGFFREFGARQDKEPN